MKKLIDILQEIEIKNSSTFERFKDFILNEAIVSIDDYRPEIREKVESSKTFDEMYKKINGWGQDYIVGDWCIKFLKKYYGLK